MKYIVDGKVLVDGYWLDLEFQLRATDKAEARFKIAHGVILIRMAEAYPGRKFRVHYRTLRRKGNRPMKRGKE